MIDSARLATLLDQIPAGAFDGVLYRAIDLEALYGFHRDPPYPAPRPLHGLGSPSHGARYTPEGGPASLYMAEDVETAYAEARGYIVLAASVSATTPRRAPPTVIITATVHLTAVLDVTSPAVQTLIETSEAELTAAWRLAQARGETPPTQALGEAVSRGERFQAIRFPSARCSGHSCWVIFPEKLSAPAFVEVYDPHRNLRERIP